MVKKIKTNKAEICKCEKPIPVAWAHLSDIQKAQIKKFYPWLEEKG